MYMKTFVLVLLLGLSLALPQEAAKKDAPVKKEAPKKVEVAKPQEAKLEAKPAVVDTPAEEEVPLEEEPVDEEITDEELILEEEGDEFVGEDEEVPLEDEIEEFSCEYTDTDKNDITVYFTKDDLGVETATEIVPAETEKMDEKLKECLQQDLTGRRNVKRRRPVRRRRPNRRRKPGRRRKGGKRRGTTSHRVLQDMRRRIAGNPNSVTVGEMKQAIKLAQRFISVKGKEARRKKVAKRKKHG